ncbi:TldD/PmbA family protein [Tissierella pigra]|uniref:TldD/PmbA family protein n=1 Tax=Tissierella pigra TaxID=2607614 RepID=UPI001C1133E6|nr:TldD/PmbA family protein [Tissierella pigra]MBU5426087.1 TldD/PmbA family protein [Tissierella pigra]
MAYRELINKIFHKGKEKMEDLEVYIENSKEIEIKVFNGEIDKYSISESGGLSLRGTNNGKMGYSYTEKIDESSIDMLINEACENAKYIDSEDEEKIFVGSDDYKEIKFHSEGLSTASIEEKIDLVKKLEIEALSLDKRVTSIQECVYKEFDKSRYIVNTKGIDLSDTLNGAAIYVAVIAKDGEDIKTGMGFRLIKDISQVDYKTIAKEAVHEAISSLGAKPIKSNNYPLVIKNTIFADLLSSFASIFSSDHVQKGMSLLKDKVETKIASPLLTIVDDPYLKDGFMSRCFDDEGTKTTYKKIVDKGVLTTYLYNWKTAKKDNVSSTSNGTRGSYKSSLSISPTNFYIEKGNNTFEELIGSIDNGVYITDVAGLHSGLNPISGDFSLSASGYEIVDGKIQRPINQITIAGNFFEVLNDIDAIGDDLEFGLPSLGYFGSPSIKINSISISGE